MNDELQITASCKKCGNVEFKIQSYSGGIFLICTECNYKININCDSHSTYRNKCVCGSKIFKAKRINDYYTSIRCINCNIESEYIYVDKCLNEVSEAYVVEVLMRKSLATCVKCNCSDFKVYQNNNEVTCLCAICSNIIAKVNYDKYTNIVATCNCGCDMFEMEFLENPNRSNNKFSPPKCIKCSSNIKEIYTDNNIVIDKLTKELLLINDKLSNLNYDISNLKEGLNHLKDKVFSQPSNIREISDKLNNIDTDLNSLEKKAKSLY